MGTSSIHPATLMESPLDGAQGLGDDQNPYPESVDILEDLVTEFVTEMARKALSIGRQGRVHVEDTVFLIQKDPRKFPRVKDLATMNEELK